LSPGGSSALLTVMESRAALRGAGRISTACTQWPPLTQGL
jgi:hypothetical protein